MLHKNLTVDSTAAIAITLRSLQAEKDEAERSMAKENSQAAECEECESHIMELFTQKRFLRAALMNYKNIVYTTDEDKKKILQLQGDIDEISHDQAKQLMHDGLIYLGNSAKAIATKTAFPSYDRYQIIQPLDVAISYFATSAKFLDSLFHENREAVRNFQITLQLNIILAYALQGEHHIQKNNSIIMAFIDSHFSQLMRIYSNDWQSNATSPVEIDRESALKKTLLNTLVMHSEKVRSYVEVLLSKCIGRYNSNLNASAEKKNQDEFSHSLETALMQENPAGYYKQPRYI